MQIDLMNTERGLVPLYDADYDEKRKLKIGKVYRAEIKVPRNLQFHKKYYALLHTAWEFQNEKTTEFFHSDFECFRKTILVAVGWCEPLFVLEKRIWVQQAKSISFSSMTETEFEDLYEKTKNVLYTIFLKNVSIDEFEKVLMNF